MPKMYVRDTTACTINHIEDVNVNKINKIFEVQNFNYIHIEIKQYVFC